MRRAKGITYWHFLAIVVQCFIFIGITSTIGFAQQEKQVFITLDVSGSMGDDKYVLANYTAQLISVLVDSGDEVYMIINGTPKRISGSNGVNEKLLITFGETSSKWPRSSNTSTQIGDIEAFNKFYKDDSEFDQWLFIIGDGIWATQNYNEIRSNFEEIVTKGNLRVCYLQTGHELTENNDFTDYLQKLKVITIRKSDTNPESIIENTNEFTSMILGLSSISINIRRTNSKCVVIKPVIPVSRFLVLYQDQVSEINLPDLENVSNGQNRATIIKKGSPSTAKTGGVKQSILSGNVWETKFKTVVAPGNEVTFCFNREIDLNKLKIFPVVSVQLSSSGIIVEKGSIKDFDEHVKGICKDNNYAEIEVNMDGFDGDSIPASINSTIKVEAISNNKTYNADYKNGKYIIKIPFSGDTTFYFIKSELPGYFSRTSKIYKIVPTDDCEEIIEPEEGADTGIKEIQLGSVNFNSEVRSACRTVTIIDSLSHMVLDPNIFDIQVIPDHKLLFKSLDIRFTKQNEIEICFVLRGPCIDCFLPDTLTFNIITSPKPGLQPNGVVYKSKNYFLKIAVEKEQGFKRCKCVLILILIALLLFIYLHFLGKKKRFKRGSKIIQHYSSFNLNPPAHQISLRKKGFSAWLNRWFNPFVDEKRAISITRVVSKTIVFYATASPNFIEFLKSAFDPQTMSYAEFDPDDRKKRIRFANSDIITVHKNRANSEKIEVSYDKRHGITNDVPAFRVFISVLKVILIAFLMFTSYLLISKNF